MSSDLWSNITWTSLHKVYYSNDGNVFCFFFCFIISFGFSSPFNVHSSNYEWAQSPSVFMEVNRGCVRHSRDYYYYYAATSAHENSINKRHRRDCDDGRSRRSRMDEVCARWSSVSVMLEPAKMCLLILMSSFAIFSFALIIMKWRVLCAQIIIKRHNRSRT